MTQGQLICTRCGREGHVAASCKQPIARKPGITAGADLGGFDSVKDMRMRCFIGEECWHLRTARGRRIPVDSTKTMRVWSRKDNCSRSARVLMWELSHKKPLPSGWVVSASCECHDCIRPAHLIAMPRTEAIRIATEQGAHKTARKSVANRIAGAKRSRISPEVWQWVYESQQSAAELGRVLGVAHSHISAKRARHRAILPGGMRA